MARRKEYAILALGGFHARREGRLRARLKEKPAPAPAHRLRTDETEVVHRGGHKSFQKMKQLFLLR